MLAHWKLDSMCGQTRPCSQHTTVLGAQHCASRRAPVHGPYSGHARSSIARVFTHSERSSEAPVQLNMHSEGSVAVPSSSSSSSSQIPLPGQLQAGDVLQGRYTIMSTLGSGSNAITYKALAADGREVAVKALTLHALRSWKQLDLFQREARTLSSLDHPGIPKYIDYFEVDGPRDRSFFLVQELAQGASLAQMVADGMRCGDEEAARILDALLGVLSYLSSLRPPVVHRDIKPENILLEGGRWGGRVFLVDFGGVQGVASAADAAAGGSTVVGTYGYMAPEQFRGQAQPASDLYALGATLLFLLTGQPPQSFPQERMRLQWRHALSAPAAARWRQLLEGLLEPVAEDRLTAQEACAVLHGQALPPRASAAARERQAGSAGASTSGSSGAPSSRARAAGLAALQQPPRSAQEAFLMMQRSLATRPLVTSKPAGSRVVVEGVEGQRLDVMIPPKGLATDTLLTGSFALAWNAFVAVWTVGALTSGGILFALFSTPFWFAGVQLVKQAFGGALTRERLHIGLSRWSLGQELAVFNRQGEAGFRGGGSERTQGGLTSDLQGARVITTMFVNDVPQTAVEVVEGGRQHRFGESLNLQEQQWLVYEINQHLEDLRGKPIDYDAMPPLDLPRTFRDSTSTDSFDESPSSRL